MDITHFFTYVQQNLGSESQFIQISSTLIQINQVNFLIDTGLQGRTDIIYVLNKIRLSALDIHYVLNTHIHPDHYGGNRYFQNAEIYLSEEDYLFQRDFLHAIAQADLGQTEDAIKRFYPQFNPKQCLYFSRIAREMANLWENDGIGNAEQIHYIEEDWPFDFIEAMATPGHSFQHYCFKILAAKNPFLVTGDALSTKSAFQLNQLDFPYCYDAKAYLESQQQIGKFQGIIIPGHDYPFDTKTRQYIDNYTTEERSGVEFGDSET